MTVENAQTTTPAPSAPAASAPPATKAPMTGAQIAAKIRASMNPAPAAAPEAKPAEGSPEAPAPAAEQPAAAPKPNHRDAAAVLAAQRAERQALQQRQAFEALQKEHADLKSRLEKLDADPLVKLAKDPIKYAEAMRDGKLQIPEDKPGLPPEMQELVEYARQQKQAEAERKQSEERKAARAADLELTTKALDAVADTYPALMSLANVHEQVLGAIERRYGGADAVTPEQFHALCKEVNDHVVGEARALVTNKSVLDALLSDDKVKGFLLEQLGLSPQQSNANGSPAKVNGAAGQEPRTLSASATNAVPSRGRGLSSAEIAAKLKNQFTNQSE